MLADYALPTAVIAISFLGSFTFSDVFGTYPHNYYNDCEADATQTNFSFICSTVDKFPPLSKITLERSQIELLPMTGILTSMGLGFTLSLLFFMDQNISAAMVNAPQNR